MATTVNVGQAPGTVLRLLSVAIAVVAVALVALAISTPGPDTASPAPGDVIDRFLSVRQAHDVGAATALFENDATITDSTGEAARGSDAATRLFERYSSYESGPRQVTGNEVVWTEALPIRTSDNLQYQQELSPELLAEVPRYAAVQVMCAVVTDGKIHAMIALPADSERSCGAVEPALASNSPLTLVVVAGIVLLFWLTRRAVREPRIGAGHVVQGLRAWRRSMVRPEL
jgi:hypothetical protein